MLFKESSPSSFCAALRRGFNTIVLENISDGVAANIVAKIVNSIPNTGVTPSLILVGHLDNKFSDLFSGGRATCRAVFGRIVFAADKFAKPDSRSVWSNKIGDFREFAETDFLGFDGEPLSLPVIETGFLTVNLQQDIDLFLEICNGSLLLAIDPTSQAKKNESEMVHDSKVSSKGFEKNENSQL
jgi:hypothetical protein